MEEIINRVKNSSIQTIDLSDFIPQETVVELDIKGQLWQELVLKEKDFREYVTTEDWGRFTNSHCAVFCSADAIVPTWAYMLVAAKLTAVGASVSFGNRAAYIQQYCMNKVVELNRESYRDARVVIKGCADVPHPEPLFVALTQKLMPVVQSLMYGEPCSTIPIYKRPKG